MGDRVATGSANSLSVPIVNQSNQEVDREQSGNP